MPIILTPKPFTQGLDYVSVSDIMDEWRKVEAENMWRFAELLFNSMILHGRR